MSHEMPVRLLIFLNIKLAALLNLHDWGQTKIVILPATVLRYDAAPVSLTARKGVIEATGPVPAGQSNRCRHIA